MAAAEGGDGLLFHRRPEGPGEGTPPIGLFQAGRRRPLPLGAQPCSPSRQAPSQLQCTAAAEHHPHERAHRRLAPAPHARAHRPPAGTAGVRGGGPPAQARGAGTPRAAGRQAGLGGRITVTLPGAGGGHRAIGHRHGLLSLALPRGGGGGLHLGRNLARGGRGR